MPHAHTTSNRSPLAMALVGGILGLAAILWGFWTTLEGLSARWSHDPQYSHGYLVPGFAAVLLWMRRSRLDVNTTAPSSWGLPLLLVGVALRLAGTRFSSDWCEAISLIPCLAGLCLSVGGWSAWRWAWPAVLFLAFMIPLPYRLAVAMADPLQRLATLASCFVMQTLGMAAVPEGNVILLNDAEIGIVEACSGLRMLVVFFALSTAVVLVVQRPWWEKVAIIVSAVPIALCSNLVRVTATGVLHEVANSEIANLFFHDAAGWLMMPLALGLLWLELKILERLLIDVTPAGPVRLGASAPKLLRPRETWKSVGAA